MHCLNIQGLQTHVVEARESVVGALSDVDTAIAVGAALRAGHIQNVATRVPPTTCPCTTTNSRRIYTERRREVRALHVVMKACAVETSAITRNV